MKNPIPRALVLAAALAAVSPGLLAQTRDSATAGETTLEAPVVNLPDFTRLVEAVGPAVVNIEATSGGRGGEDDELAREGAGPTPEQMPEFFRRFFGQPGMPGMPDRSPRGGISQGSGFIISSDGYVLTNHHVVDGADRIIVRLSDRNELVAELVGSDPLSDVALLKVEGRGLPVLRTGDSRNLKAGQWVLAIGSPFGFEHSVTAGIVSGVGRRSLDPSQQYVPFIQTDVAINRGNSGGPLLNTRGEVVGINSQIFSNSGGYMGVSFAIPIEVAMNAVRQLRETGKVTRGQLGVRIQDVDRERLKELGLDRPTGAFVDSVENGSAADKAGIRPGDVITRFNGREVPRSASLPPMVGALPPGSRATVTVVRDGKARDLVVTLSALDLAAAGAADPADRPAAPDAAANPLGLEVEALDAAARSAMGLGAGEGVLLSRVTGLAARQAGLAPGDVILRLGQQDVGSVAEFEAAAKGLKTGDEVRLLVRNARSTGFVSFVLR
ncbi:Do family serine endopeptidase [Arenimonas sp.]|uniref:Do family serine endopeptidase n=1 Tax=Arenimonas sp. TaxID=1872635 RepID=UPI0035B1A371